MIFEYGCIGEVLRHSFSAEIHAELADYDYRLIEIARSELENFAKEKNFKGINVTIPYKELIIPYLDEIDPYAKEIGAVNTVVNKNGKLYGYNTDFFGMKALINHLKLDLSGKKVAILGTGGTSKTAYAVARACGASDIIKVSRRDGENTVTYSELYEKHCDTEIVINTTPCGMYPEIYASPIEPERLPKLSGVIDAVYNPLRTPLIIKSKKLGIKAEGGLYMLVAQAVAASELFLDKKYPESEIERIYNKLSAKKENIVLIGMPACGKSTVGRLLADKTERVFIDTDTLIEENEVMKIPEIFEKYGEKYFRDAETKAVKQAALSSAQIIATGGGAILREENTEALCENGRLYFIDRPLECLIPTESRPLSSTKEAITKRYEERYPIYIKSADKIIDANTDAESVAARILEEHFK